MADTFFYLAIYVGIALVVVLLVGRHDWFRRLTGDVKLGGKVKRDHRQFAVDKLASVGASTAARDSLGKHTFKSAIGLRIVGPVLCLILVYNLFKVSGESMTPDVFTDPDPMMLGLMALASWYTLFIWSYEITIDRNELTHIGLFFNTKRFDLNTLESADEDSQGLWRLYFEDGRSTDLMKYVTGSATLKTVLMKAAKA